jgi:predicted hydrolase (HD superfamily)
MEKQQLNLVSAKELLFSKMQNQNLRRHCMGVGKTLSEFWDFYKSEGRQKEIGSLSKEEWEVVGILHDSDWEETTNTSNEHTKKLLEWLSQYDAPEEMLNVFRSHNNKLTYLREPQTLLEWTLECCDELTGFIVAVTLLRPNKKLSEVEVESVFKKFKQKEFARQVDRQQILQCEEKTGVDSQTFVRITLEAMQKNSDLLGL